MKRRANTLRSLSACRFAILALAAGCTNDPGAARMTVERACTVPEAPINVRLRVVFTATGNRAVALSNTRNLTISIHPALTPTPDTARTELTTWLAYCGTPIVGLMMICPPIIPVLIAARVLDVADLGGRYAVVSPTHSQAVEVEFLGVARGQVIASILERRDRAALNQLSSMPTFQWPPGEYHLRVTMPAADPIFAPLGWTMYTHALSADLTLRVPNSSAE